MKKKSFLILMVVIIALFVGIGTPLALAQAPQVDWANLLLQLQLPNSATGGVEMIAVWLAAVAGLAASAITDAVKGLPIFTDEERRKIAGPMANLTAALISVLSGYIVAKLGVAAGLLDQSGLWQVLLFVWPMAKGWFETQKLTRAR